MSKTYSKKFSDQEFWTKIKSLSGLYRALKEKAILLWLVLKDDTVPIAAKAGIVTALGYLICPIDAVPDILPGGLLDDAAVLSAALALVDAYITKAMRREARSLSK